MARATKIPESVDKLFGKRGRPTDFDRYIEERLLAGDSMSDMVLVVPQSMGAPDELETRYGRLWVLSSQRVDRCYLLSVKDKPPDEMAGVVKGDKAKDGRVQVP